MLYNARDLFEKIKLDASEHFGIVPVIIEKDYFATISLKGDRISNRTSK